MTMKERRREKDRNLDNKIYFVCYSQPRPRTEVAELIYGRNNTQSYPTITGKKDVIKRMVKNDEIEIKRVKEMPLENKKYIFYTPESNKKYDIDITDGRQKRSIYIFSKVKPVFNHIIDNLDRGRIKLNDDEKDNILNILKNHLFRESIEDVTPIKDNYGKLVPNTYGSIGGIESIFAIFFNFANVAFVLKNTLNDEKALKRYADLIDKLPPDKIVKKARKNKAVKNVDNLFNVSLNKKLMRRELFKIFLKQEKSLLKKLTVFFPDLY